MKLSVFFTPLGITDQSVARIPTIVIDVLRCTSTIVAAMANGARSVVPASTGDDALRIASNLESDDVLLTGERGLQRIEGFQLGNSPLEMTSDVVAGKTLVMTTTNGTVALLAVDAPRPVLIGAITNFSAAVTRAQEEFERTGEIVILCSGRRSMFALEDAYVAGRFTAALVPWRVRRQAELNDAAIAALELVRRYGGEWKRAVSASAAARDLKALGFKKDIEAATEVDAHNIVPVYSNRIITLPDST